MSLESREANGAACIGGSGDAKRRMIFGESAIDYRNNIT
jgi:hypothetical protein